MLPRLPHFARSVPGRAALAGGLFLTVSVTGVSVALADVPSPIPSTASTASTIRPPAPSTSIPPTTVPGGGAGTSSTIGGSTVTSGGQGAGATTVPVPTTASGGGSGSGGESGLSPWVPAYGGVVLFGALAAGAAVMASRRRRTEGEAFFENGASVAVGSSTADALGTATAVAATTAAAATGVVLAGEAPSEPAPAPAAQRSSAATPSPSLGLGANRPGPADIEPVDRPTPASRARRFDVAPQLASDWATADAAADVAAGLAERIQDAKQTTVAVQAADDWAAAARVADAQWITALENRLRALEGVEGADVGAWRARLVAELERVRAG